MIQGNIPNVLNETGTGADTVLECHLNEHVQVSNDSKQVIQGTNVNGNKQDNIRTPAAEAVTRVPQVNTIHSPYLSSYVPLQIQGCKIFALVDTGGEISVMNSNVVYKYPAL